MKKLKVKIVFVLLIFSLSLFSQIKIKNAKVVAFKVLPLKGVTVSTKKSKTVVKTDSLGMFSINLVKNDYLIVNAEGFEGYKAKIKNDDPLTINLLYYDNNASYNSVLENKYLSKENLDYAIKNLMADNNIFDRMQNIYEVVQYAYPGAIFDPSTGVMQIILANRGPHSVMAGNEALLVVDGIVTSDITGISPAQVKTIRVLVGNDAANWGSRGANGVIEIELKHK